MSAPPSRLRYALSTTRVLAWRALVLVRRMPSVFIPSLVMPLFILISTAGAFHGMGQLPIGTDSYLRFVIPFATLMGSGFAGVNSGMTLARDLEGGFVDRLAVSPSPRIALLAGPLAGTMLRSVFTTTVVLVAGVIGQAPVPGIAALVVMYLMAGIWAVATSCWAMGVALRAKTVQATPMMQMVVFLAIFTSVAYAPRELQLGWLRTIADWNPVTYLMEASRAAELHGVSWDRLGPGLAAGALLIGVLGVWAGTGLRRINGA